MYYTIKIFLYYKIIFIQRNFNISKYRLIILYDSFLPNDRFRSEEIRVITIEANIAVKNESILKPETILAVITRRIAFITNIKSPSVRIVTGKVRRIRIGLNNRFSTPRIAATTSAVMSESI